MESNDSTATIQTMINKVLQFRTDRNWNPDSRSLAISISLEASELLEHFQWSNEPKQINKQEIADELADVLIYTLQFAVGEGIDLSTAITDKLARQALKYPAGLTSDEYYKAKAKSRAAVSA